MADGFSPPFLTFAESSLPATPGPAFPHNADVTPDSAFSPPLLTFAESSLPATPGPAFPHDALSIEPPPRVFGRDGNLFVPGGLQVLASGVVIGSPRADIGFTAGANFTITLTEDVPNKRINVTFGTTDLTGPAGPTGPAGATGSIGPQGAQGAQGGIGVAGASGINLNDSVTASVGANTLQIISIPSPRMAFSFISLPNAGDALLNTAFMSGTGSLQSFNASPNAQGSGIVAVSAGFASVYRCTAFGTSNVLIERIFGVENFSAPLSPISGTPAALVVLGEA